MRIISLRLNNKMPLIHIDINLKEYTILNWYIKHSELIHPKTGKPLSIHRLMTSRIKQLIEDELEPEYVKWMTNNLPHRT